MGFSYLSALALFYLVLMAGVKASQPAEEYWRSVWPNNPVPKGLWDLLQPASGETELPIKASEHMQYWTAFFEHDLHPGKKISLGLQRHSSAQPVGAWIWGEKALKTEEIPQTQPLGAWIWGGKALQTKENSQTQPLGAWIWGGKTLQTKENPQIQPLGAWIWGRKTFQTEENPQTQSLGAWIWGRKAFQMEGNSQTQPLGVLVWGRKASQLKKSKVKEIKKGIDSLENICETPSTIGEDKYCPTSLESMMDFAISKLGKNIKVISSSFASNHEQYTVEEVRKVGDKAVMCHRLNFQKVVFYCHEVNATTSYIVPLVASDGTKSKALTICHHDTRGMDPHLLYEALKVKPGTVPVCHFVGNKAIAWIPNSLLNEVDRPCVQ